MNAAEARQLTNAYFADKVDSKTQIADIQTAIEAAANTGKSSIEVTSLTKENEALLKADGFKISYMSNSLDAVIKW